MRHKRPIPWIHRWSRLIMAAIATSGAIVTAYFTVVKFTQSFPAGQAGDCNAVLYRVV